MTVLAGRDWLVRLLSITATALALLTASGQSSKAAPFDVRTFRPWSGYAIPNGVWLTADLNGDAKGDIVHVVMGADYIHTWLSQGDGTFNVGTFRPWAGYAMPNGLWFTGDLNGDGRSDLVHAVQGADYIHTWLSNGDGTFAVGTFRPWAGYAIPNGVWVGADLNGDHRMDLVHVVNGADYVHTWLSNGDGTFAVGTFRPWVGYAMPNGEWLVADLNGDGRQDIIHAVQGADYVHTWLSNGDGTFAIGTFRPWAGYAIPNGLWRVVDLNGDGRGDIVHIVASGDYVHTWLSQGDGTFAVGTFRPWAGYAMPNGLWLTGDFDGDGKGDLVHAVQDTSYVHTWLSKGDGSFAVGTFSPWAGYVVPNGLWLTADHDGDGRMDIVHAVNASDYVHVWLSVMPRPGEFAIDGLEVTQAIQDMGHTVPLVENKPSVVRAYPAFNAVSGANLRGELQAWHSVAGWTTIASVNTASVNPSDNGNLRVKREATNNGLNFVLPATHLAQGNLFVRVGRLLDAASGNPVICADCGSTARWVSLGDPAPMRLRVLGLSYTRGTVTQPPATFAPQPVDFTLLGSWLRRAYPTGALSIGTATVNANAVAPFGCGDANAQIAAIRALDVASGTDARTHYYAMVYDDGDDRSFFMRGCAAGIPGSPSPQTVASGPTGPSTWGWDGDGSYGDWYGGHELGHTYGRLHIGSGCGESSDDPSYPYPAGQISANDGAFVGFDTGDPANGIAMAALPGTVWRDVMSYCANQWVSDYTYTRIRDRLIAENGLPAGAMPLVAGAAVAAAGTPAALGGPPALVEGTGTAPVEELGDGEVAVMVAPAGTRPAVVPSAISPPSLPPPAYLREVAVVVGNPPEALPKADVRTGQAIVSVEPAAAPPVAPASGSPAAAVREGDFLSVVATVNISRKSGKIGSIRRIGIAAPALGGANAQTRLAVLDGAGTVIASYDVPFLPNSERDPGEDLKGIVDAVIPFSAEARSLQLIVEGAVVDSFNAPPSAGTRLSAAAGATITVDRAAGQGPVATFKWPSAGEDIVYDVQVSADDGVSWQTVAIGLAKPEAQLDLASFGTSGDLKLRILANSGFTSGVVGETTLSLANR